MFGRIVVGTDGSETASEAVRRAIELAKLSGATLEIVSAVEPTGRLATAPLHAVHPREDVSVTLDSAAAEARKEGLEVESHSREGDPVDAILDLAEETAADLIVVGNKGMAGTKRFLLGSVPDKISHQARCGVWIVHTT